MTEKMKNDIVLKICEMLVEQTVSYERSECFRESLKYIKKVDSARYFGMLWMEIRECGWEKMAEKMIEALDFENEEE